MRLWVRGRLWALVVMVALMVSPFPARANANGSFSIGITPALVNIQATPGQLYVRRLSLLNEGTIPIQPSTGVRQFQDAGGVLSAVPWLQVVPAETPVIPPGRQATITVTLTVPPDAASGQRFALVFGLASAGAGENNAGVGALFAITVYGAAPVVQLAELDGLEAMWTGRQAIDFQTTLHNAGNTRLSPHDGSVQVYRDGAQVAQIGLESPGFVLPGRDGLYQAEAPFAFVPGAVYSATAAVNYGATQPLTATTGFEAVGAVAIDGVVATGNPGRNPQLQIVLTNRGGLWFRPDEADLLLFSARGYVSGQLTQDDCPGAAPGAQQTVPVSYTGALDGGPYTALVVLKAPGLSLEDQVALAYGGLPNYHLWLPWLVR